MDPSHDVELAKFDDELQRRLEAEGKCAARKRDGSGTLCKNKAGKGTIHLGKGRCYLHGGIKNAKDKRIKHGRYSTVSDKRLAELIEELSEDPNPLDVIPELTLARANLIDWTERFSELKTAILAWHEDQEGTARPDRVPRIQELQPLLEAISRIVYRIERAQSDKYIPRGQFYRVMMAMGRVIDSRVMDEELRELIKDDWLRIEVP